MRTLTRDNDGKSVRLRVGETFEVRLPENATTGYRWALDVLDEDLVALKEADADYAGRSVGSGGEARFSLRANRPGKAELAFKYWRHWEGDASIAERFRVSLEIEP